MINKGKLYLIPNLLAPVDAREHCAPVFSERIKHIRHFVVESEKESRRFLRNLIRDFDIDGSSFELLNEHSKNGKLSKLLAPARSGFDIGLMSDAGCPAIADPGSGLVLEAHAAGIQVIPLVGPSSILMTLMSSGMNGQAFCFHGYLPKDNSERLRFIKDIEYHSRQFGYSQLFMDTPYRNRQVYEELLKVCSNDTLMCIGMEITAESEYIRTLPIGDWKKIEMPDIHKKPCMFAISG
jgi:16S rRNA (cytidine1402-2'-O)-methyltransferase